VFVYLPSTCTNTKVTDDGVGWFKGAIAIVATDKNTVLPKTNDIRQTVASDIGQEAQMPVESPTAPTTEIG